MAAITVNVEQEDKELFNSICNKLGMNISTAINIFIKKVNATRSIPFSLELEPEWNDETIAAFEEAKAISEGKIPAKRYDSVSEMMDDILNVAEDEPKYGVWYMTYELVYTNSFKKDLKLAQKRNYDMNKMKDVLILLKSSKKLPAKYKDHELKGDWKGFRELHISPDWLLIYTKNKTELILTLTRTGSHSELFKK